MHHESETAESAETLLLVEDDVIIRSMFAGYLQREGYCVISARNGEDAIDAVAAYAAPIHLVVTDVIMPKMGGRALFDTLRRWYPRLRVLFISGYDSGALATAAVLDDRTDFLSKPFGPSLLAERVRRLLGAELEGV